MVNLIAGRRIVPELIQHDFTASKVVEQLRPLLENEEARATMQSDLRTVGAALKVSNEKWAAPGDRTDCDRACRPDCAAIDPRSAAAAVAICFGFIMAR